MAHCSCHAFRVRSLGLINIVGIAHLQRLGGVGCFIVLVIAAIFYNLSDKSKWMNFTGAIMQTAVLTCDHTDYTRGGSSFFYLCVREFIECHQK
jgi:hypothetical protein